MIDRTQLYVKKGITVKVRDSQKSRVYAWDRSLEQGEPMTLDECRQLIESVWEKYAVAGCTGTCALSGTASYRTEERRPAAPTVVDGRGTTIARGGLHRISLPRWARTKPVVLHECAHAILEHREFHQRTPGGVAAHGPEFARIFMELLVRFGGYERRTIREAATLHKIKIGPLSDTELSVKPYAVRKSGFVSMESVYG